VVSRIPSANWRAASRIAAGTSASIASGTTEVLYDRTFNQCRWRTLGFAATTALALASALGVQAK
jgi:hypothetical protein